MLKAPALLALLLTASCGAPGRRSSVPERSAHPVASAKARNDPAEPTHQREAAPQSVVTEPDAELGVTCGALNCLAFPSARAAFRHVLARAPRVLAVGETHAQKGSEAIPSTTRRFTELLLPDLVGRASDIVLELWLSAKCGDVEQRVAERQKPITEQQAANNQGEFVALGQRAKSLGIAPHALVPSCEEYHAIANAGEADIDRMLQMIATTTERDLQRLLDATASRSPAPLLVAYGGALHNDVSPRPGREAWSFGPALVARLGATYVELDLIVPEFIKDNESYRAQPWYEAHAAHPLPEAHLLYATGPNSFALIFAETRP